MWGKLKSLIRTLKRWDDVAWPSEIKKEETSVKKKRGRPKKI
jgi:hypothetical protein